jgi:hypothetical protein
MFFFITNVAIKYLLERHLNIVLISYMSNFIFRGGKRKMKTKIVGILVCTLLIATALPAVGTMNEEEIPMKFIMGSNSLNHPSIHRNMINTRGGLFLQLPAIPGLDLWISDAGEECYAYDDFWEVTDPICDIHWWGATAFFNGQVWEPGDPSGITFNITFYENDGDLPGAVVCSYSDIVPSVTPTGIIYDHPEPYFDFEVYYFSDVELNPCCDLTEGWVSIYSTYSPHDCILGWAESPDGNSNAVQFWDGTWWALNDDLAYMLTDGGEEPIPELDCKDDLSWTDIKPGDVVNGSFEVANIGEPDSILHWKIESYPNWGSNWTFTPNASILTIGADWITVNVSFVAPDDTNEEFTGEVKIVNVMDSSNSCTIDVSLATPVNQQVDMHPLFQRILERFPNAFPILRHLLAL